MPGDQPSQSPAQGQLVELTEAQREHIQDLITFEFLRITTTLDLGAFLAFHPDKTYAQLINEATTLAQWAKGIEAAKLLESWDQLGDLFDTPGIQVTSLSLQQLTEAVRFVEFCLEVINTPLPDIE